MPTDDGKGDSMGGSNAAVGGEKAASGGGDGGGGLPAASGGNPNGGNLSGGGAAAASGTGGNSAGAAGSAGAEGNPSGGSPSAPPFMLGADVSWLLEDEASGATYSDRGNKADLLVLLHARGFNYIRIRTFVDPAAAGGYAAGKEQAFCDLAHTITLAKRVRALGMGFLLDFHYSDNFADPGKQVKPAAWAALPFTDLVQHVHDYTFDTLTALAKADVLPDLVQIGNEITAGMLFPDGSSSDANWPKLAQLLNAGASAAQEVDPAIRIMLHLDKGGNNATTRWWVDHALAEHLPFQILGQSCYTMYQGTPDQWQANFTDLVTRYPTLNFVIAEYSPEKRKANDIMFGLPDHRGLGTFIWEPTRWMEAVFDRNAESYVGNGLLDIYSQISHDYGLAP